MDGLDFLGTGGGDADCMWKIHFDADRDHGRLQLVRVSVRVMESTADICSLRVCNQWPIKQDRYIEVATHVSVVPKMDIYVPPLTFDILGLPAALVLGDHHTLSVMAAPGGLPNAFPDNRMVPVKNFFKIPNSPLQSGGRTSAALTLTFVLFVGKCSNIQKSKFFKEQDFEEENTKSF